MRRALAVLAVAAVACSDTEFTPRWKVDRFRLLAVIADPPDAVTGETVTLSAVTANRPGAPRDAGFVWLSCARVTIDNNTGARGCADAVPGLLAGNPARLTLAETPRDAAPWTVFGLACRGGTPSFDPVTMQPRCEGGEAEVFLRTIRQRGVVANHNPRIAFVTLDGAEMRADTATRVAPCAITDRDARYEQCTRHLLGVLFATDARETVSEVQPDGSARRLPEALVTEFVVDGGDLDGAFRSDNDLEAGATTHANGFRAPASGAVNLWVIVRDGRGGFDVVTRAIDVAM